MFLQVYKPYQIRKALDMYDKYRSFRKVQTYTGISKSTVHRWWHTISFLRLPRQRYQTKKKKRTRSPKYKELVTLLKSLFTDTCLRYWTLDTIRITIGLKYSQIPSKSWIHNLLPKAQLRKRKFVSTKLVSSNKSRFDAQVTNFVNIYDKLQDHEIVCIDETGFCNLGNSMYTYYPIGKEPQQSLVTKREKRSMIMAIHPLQGSIAFEIQKAPFNGDSFCSFLKENVLPRLVGTKAIIMDNVSFHKTRAVRSLLDSFGVIPLYIPPYSPRCNPIEEVFSLVKRSFRNTNDVLDNIDFRIQNAVERLNLFKGLPQFYKHTRQYVDTCLKSR